MEEIFENDLELKPPNLTSPCLICAENEQEESLDSIGGLIEGPEENTKLFTLLCKSLKIKLTKKNSWDFKKEALPFCASCLETSRELVEIQEQIRQLESKFRKKVEKLKNLVIESECREDSGEKEKKFEVRDLKYYGKFVFFRKQITGDAGDGEGEFGDLSATELRLNVPWAAPVVGYRYKVIKQPRIVGKYLVISGRNPDQTPRVSYKKSTTPAKPKNIINVSVEESNLSNVGRRRSGRVAQMVAETKLDESKYFNPEDANEDEIEREFQFRSESGDDAHESKPVVDPSSAYMDVQSFLEIKPEPESEMEEDGDWEAWPSSEQDMEVSTSSTSNTATTSANVRASIKRTHKSSKSKRTKRKRAKSVLESESDSNQEDDDSDYRPENSGESDHDGKSSGKYIDYGRHEGKYKWYENKNTDKILYRDIEVTRIENGLKCKKCELVVEGGKLANHRSRMKRHINLKHHLPQFVCKLCDKAVENRFQLDLHIKTVHEKSVVIPCNICQKPFSSRVSMRRHAWDHQSEEEKQAAIAAGKKKLGTSRKRAPTFQCGQCGKMFVEQRVLEKHEETHLDINERPKFVCQICGTVYSSESGLKTHFRLKHDTSKTHWLQCPACPKKCARPALLKEHMISHTGLKPVRCPEPGCEVRCRTNALLKVHLNMHKDIRPHQCQDCDMAFFQRYHLRRHREVYHDKNKPPPARKQSYRSRDGTRKPYIRKNKKKIQRHGRDDNPEERSHLIDPLQVQPPQYVPENNFNAENQQLLGFLSNNMSNMTAPVINFNYTNL